MPDKHEAATIIADLEGLLPLAKRSNSITLLQGEIARQRSLAETATAGKAPPAVAPVPLKTEKAEVPAGPVFGIISKYAWDQSNKFVKVYVTIPGIEEATDDNITLECTATSLRFEVQGLPKPPTALRLSVAVLHSAVDEKQVSWARKSDSMILIKLRKASEGEEWESLDDGAIKKARKKEADLEANKGKSTQELLAKMYDEADEDGKASLAAAWEAGRAKREGRS